MRIREKLSPVMEDITSWKMAEGTLEVLARVDSTQPGSQYQMTCKGRANTHN